MTLNLHLDGRKYNMFAQQILLTLVFMVLFQHFGDPWSEKSQLEF